LASVGLNALDLQTFSREAPCECSDASAKVKDK
jgi:hypothetical protein